MFNKNKKKLQKKKVLKVYLKNYLNDKNHRILISSLIYYFICYLFVILIG